MFITNLSIIYDMGTIRNIQFNEALHKYTDEQNLVYTSVTTVIGKYHEHFDRDHWALEKSLDTSIYNPYHGMSPEEIKAQWAAGTEFSINRGNKTHKVLEDSINEANGKSSFEFEDSKQRIGTGKGLVKITMTNIDILAKTQLAIKYPKIFNYLKEYIEQGWTLYAEKRVYWFEYLIAGTIDCLLVKDNFFMIVDWKTNNKKLEFRSGYYKKVRGVVTTQWVDKNERFFPPLNTIPFCKGHIYTLQLSLYAHLMELWGYKCMGLTLFHIFEDVPQAPITIIYWEQHCKNLCNHFVSGSNINRNTNTNNNPSTKGNTLFGIS